MKVDKEKFDAGCPTHDAFFATCVGSTLPKAGVQARAVTTNLSSSDEPPLPTVSSNL
jgi:hypothetical protein